MHQNLLDEPLIEDSSSHSIFNNKHLLTECLESLDAAASDTFVVATMKHPVKIIDNLYLGTIQHARNESELSKLGITHVFDCSASKLYGSLEEETDKPLQTATLEYHHICTGSTDSKQLPFDEAIGLIRRCFQKKPSCKILLCCLTGINRSAAICIAYLMTATHKSLMDATIIVRERAGQILRVEGVQTQLIQFAESRGYLGQPSAWPKRCNSDFEEQILRELGSFRSTDLPPDDADKL